MVKYYIWCHRLGMIKIQIESYEEDSNSFYTLIIELLHNTKKKFVFRYPTLSKMWSNLATCFLMILRIFSATDYG